MYCKCVHKKMVHLLVNYYQLMLQFFNVRTVVIRCTFPHTQIMLHLKKLPSYGIPALLKKDKYQKRESQQDGKTVFHLAGTLLSPLT